MRDPSGEDKVVYLSVENVEVRIAAGAGTGAEAEAGTGTGTDVGMGTRAEADSANDAYIALREDGQDIVLEPLEGAMPLASVFPIEFLFASGASSSGTELVLNQEM